MCNNTDRGTIRVRVGASHGETTARACTSTKNRGSWYWSKHHPLHSRPNYTSQLALSNIFSQVCASTFAKKRKIKNGNNAYACDYPSRRQNLLLSFFLSFFIFVHSLLSPVVPRLFERSSRFFLSLIFVYFLLFVDLFADLCSIFFVLFLSLFYSSLLLVPWHVSASHQRAESMLRALNFFFPPLSSTLCL